MRAIAALLFAVVVLAPARASRAAPVLHRVAGTCMGRWVGTGVQQGLPPWSIDMVVTKTEGTDCGTIEYPSLRCGGVLASCTMHGGVAHFVERYTHNPGTCAPAGVIDATCHDTTLGWVWSGQEVVGSTLHRP